MIAAAKRRRKSKPGNVTTADDVRLFQVLSKRARALAAAPLTDAVGLVQAAEKAAKAVPPERHRHVDSPFVKLVRLGGRFLLLASDQRQEAAGDLRIWADAIDAALTETPLTSVRPVRATPVYRAPYAENDR